eukprot:gene34168-44144_t
MQLFADAGNCQFHPLKKQMLSKPEFHLLRLYEERLGQLRRAEEERLMDRQLISDAVTSAIAAADATVVASVSNVESKNPIADSSDNFSKKVVYIPPKYTRHGTSLVPAQEIEPGAVESNEPVISTARAIDQRAAIAIDFDDLPDSVAASRSGIFSSAGTVFEQAWSSALTSSLDLNILLPGFCLFDPEQPEPGVQTLVLQLSVPTNSIGWALNLCPATTSADDDLFLSDVLFHFNPRYEGKKKGLVMNDRQGTWGSELRRQLGDSSGDEKLLLRNMEVMIQIREQAFVVFVGGTLSDFFVHRRLISGYVDKPLRLLMPTLDGNGRRHGVQLKKAQEQLSEDYEAFLAGVSADSNIANVALCTVQVSGLPVVKDLVENYEMEKQIKELFAEYEYIAVQMVPGRGLAFVRLPTSDAVDRSILDLDGVIMDPDGSNLTLHMSRKRKSSLICVPESEDCAVPLQPLAPE